MTVQAFNECWRVSALGENAFTSVCLPHDAMRYEGRSKDAPSGTHGAYFIGKDYEYRKTFSIDGFSADERYVLFFEGAYRCAEVCLNGKLLQNHDYGFTHFCVELTNAQAEHNELCVITRNADQPNCRWYAGSGLYRPVHLLRLPRRALDIFGVCICTLDYVSKTLSLTCTGAEKGRAQFWIEDGDAVLYAGETVVGERTVFRLEHAELWNVDNPKLYTLRVRYGADERTQVFGIRKVEVSRKNGFTLNGERVILRGACVHSDNGMLGAEAHPFADERKIALLKEAGYNAIRSAHNPCSEATLRACDKLGMLVLDEYTDGWYVHKTRYDYANRIERNWQSDVTAMVEKDFNHPCVVMYSLGNEVGETSECKGIALAEEMTAYLHRLDETRPITCGINIFFNYLYSLGFGVYNDKKAEKGEKVGSAFFNMLAGVFGDKTMKIGATLRGSDVKTRDAFAKLDVAGYNYGILRYKKDLKKYPKRIILGTETFCKDAYAFFELAKAHAGIIGDFVWAGMDYLGEVAIGSWEYQTYAPTFLPSNGWISAGSGRLDLSGRMLGEGLYTRVAFGLDTVRMAVVPVDGYKKKHSPSAWKMTNAMESWLWDGLEGKKTCVEIYARAYAVELRLNGKRIAKKRVKNGCVVRCKTRFAKGELQAVALDKSGTIIGETRLHSAVGDIRLTAIAEQTTIGANDLAYVRLRYADEAGQISPVTRGRIKVETDGELLALGHACPYNADGYLRSETDVYYGEALAIIRPKLGQKRILCAAFSERGNSACEVVVQ